MDVKINLSEPDLKRIQTKLRHLGDALGGRIQAQEVNRTADNIRADGVRRVKAELPQLAVSTIRRRIERRGTATATNPATSVAILHRSINLERFGARLVRSEEGKASARRRRGGGRRGRNPANSGGVIVNVKGGTKYVHRAFIIPARFGKGDAEGTTNIVVWRPRGSGGKRLGRRVKALLTTSVFESFGNKLKEALSRGGALLLRNLSRRVRQEMAGRGIVFFEK